MVPTELDSSQVSWLTVTDANAGQRLDNFLLSTLKGVPKTLIYRIIRKGEVRINKKRAKADTRLQEGDLLRIPPLRLPQKGETPPVSSVLRDKLDAAIVYEDDALLVVNKPSGLAVHGGSGVNLGMIEALRKMRPQHAFLELVHRLDRDTSGLVLVAKKRKALTTLQRMLADKQGIGKYYLALVHGHWPQQVNHVDLPLLRTERQSGERVVRVDDDGKTALTRYRLLAAGSHYSLVQAEPVTGRTHQIRVHCLSQGCTIAGDVKYHTAPEQQVDAKYAVTRLCLHAWRLSFRHPVSGEWLDLQALPDAQLAGWLDSLAGRQWRDYLKESV